MVLSHLTPASAQSFVQEGRWDHERYVYKLNSRYAVWENEDLSNVVAGIARRVEGANGLPPYAVLTDIVLCPLANAAVRPGGWLTLCLPLVIGSSTEDELAFVIAHEIAHILLKHLEGRRPDRPSPFGEVEESDADLLGIPVRITIGKKSIADGKVEIKLRRESDSKKVDVADCTGEIITIVDALKNELK